MLELRDIAFDRNDLFHFSRLIFDRTVGGREPNSLFLTIDPGNIPAKFDALVEVLPKDFVLIGAHQICGAEHGMVFVDDLSQLIAHETQKVLVGVQHAAIWGELNHAISGVNGGSHPLVVANSGSVQGRV